MGGSECTRLMRRRGAARQRHARMRAELVGAIVASESLLEERVREVQALSRLTSYLATSHDLDEILREGLSRALEVLEMDAGAVYSTTVADPGLQLRVQFTTARFTESLLAELHAGLMSRSALTLHSRITWASNLEQSPQPGLPAHSPTRSYLVAPIKVRDRLIGALEILSAQEHSYSLHELHLVEVLASQMAVAIEAAHMREALALKEHELTTLHARCAELGDSSHSLHSRQPRTAFERSEP